MIAEILKRRLAGRTTCAMIPIEVSGPHSAIADAAVQAHGFRGLGTGWLAISATDAHEIATSLLHRDLAHCAEIMPFDVASGLAERFFDLAPEPHAYFTNGDWDFSSAAERAPATLTGWDPISDSTFDAGIVCVGDGTVALLWVEDED